MQTSSGIKDKVVVITGASSGIGEATALLLAGGGAKLVLGARGLDRLQALATGIANQGGEVSYSPTDVRRRDDVCALVNLACDKFALPPNAIARAIAFAIEQPDDVDVNELIVRPTAQG